MRRKGLVFLLILSVGFLWQTGAQNLYWEYPQTISSGTAKFSQVAAGEDFIIAAWQEIIPVGANVHDIYLSFSFGATEGDWETSPRLIGPIRYRGEPAPVFSMAIDGDGRIHVAVSESDALIRVFTSEDSGRTFSESAKIELGRQGGSEDSGDTVVAPRLFVRSDDGLILYGSRRDPETQRLAIYYSLSDSGRDWAPFIPLANLEREGIIRTFLPHHLVFNGRDYVFFQAVIPSEDASYFQIFSKMSADAGQTWGEIELVTGFDEVVLGQVQSARLYDNQRPYVAAVGDTIALVWERREGNLGSPSIFYLELDGDGTIVTDPERVSSAAGFGRFPRVFLLNGQIYMTWFSDDSGSDEVYIANRQAGGLWLRRTLSPSEGEDSFARPVVVDDIPVVVWEQQEGDDQRIALLRPDTEAAPPLFVRSESSFFENGRFNQQSYVAGWTLPVDSSGIAGFTYVWDTDPDGEAPEDLDVSISPDGRQIRYTPQNDGWQYLHVKSVDYAGNWSDTATFRFFHDATPPGKVVFDTPALDSAGYLTSNSATVSWNAAAPDSDVARYLYSFDRVSDLGAELETSEISLRTPTVTDADGNVAFRNIDNGVWALRVSAVDGVGNIGEPSDLFLRLNKYIPVTFINTVFVEQDDLGFTDLEILGRGFSDGGLVDYIVLDRDGEEGSGWDYRIDLSSGTYEVIDDRRIVVTGLTEIDPGTYSVGVHHPLRRGPYFQPEERRFIVEQSGTVKYGYFGGADARQETRWNIASLRKYTLSANTIALGSVFILAVVILVFSIQRMGRIVAEGRQMAQDARAFLAGTITADERIEKDRELKKRSFGLRLKFAVFTIIIVVSVVVILALPLSIYVTNTQEETLAEGLEKQVNVLLEGIATGAKEYLPLAEGRTLDLRQLPAQSAGVEDTRYVIIAGRPDRTVDPQTGQTLPDGYDYVWATNDSDIATKVNQSSYNETSDQGRVRLVGLEPELYDKISELQSNVEAEGANVLPPIQDQIRSVQQEQRELLEAGSEPDSEEYISVSERIVTLRGQERALLDEIGKLVLSYPYFDTKDLDTSRETYTFLKPIVYVTPSDQNPFKGVIIYNVSIESIIEDIRQSRRALILITSAIAAFAILFGILGAIVMASIIIKPIKRLVAGVEVISDTEDKAELHDHLIEVQSKDEIAGLAETINQMTRGLVEAAEASKDLTMGQDLQKGFTPIEKDPVDPKRRLTTFKLTDEGIECFGYYEGAWGVSGDYFDYKKLDDDHYAIIETDVAGKGIPASLIMVVVATVFNDYFKNWRADVDGAELQSLVYRINDLVEERGFEGRFAALVVSVINKRTGQCWFCHAGANLVHVYDSSQRKVIRYELPEAPAAGVFSNDLVSMGGGFKVTPMQINPGDLILFFTDGIEEAQAKFLIDSEHESEAPGDRGADVNQKENSYEDNTFEEFGIERIYTITEAVVARGTYTLTKERDPAGEDAHYDFDYSQCEGSAEDVIMALISAERVFRVYPDPSTTRDDRIEVDRKIDAFLEEHFAQYNDLFPEKTAHNDRREYLYYLGVKEHPQFDDLTILALRKG